MELFLDTMSSFLPSNYFAILIICFIIVMTCVSGDYLLSQVLEIDWPINGHIIRAITDSSTHGIIGALVWAIAENSEQLNVWTKWRNCFFCAFLAMSVDLDHFLAAGSLDLRKALSLTSRPYFHNTSLIAVVMVLCMITRQYIPNLHLFSLMFLSSWLSHHLRDANHHGLWLFPFGHTPIIPSYLYIALILLLALLVRTINYTIINARIRHSLSIV